MRQLHLILVVALAACGGGAAPAGEEPPIPQAPAGTDRVALKRETELLEDLGARTCACEDRACREKTDDELTAYFRDTATINDVVENVETWPADLDARARRVYSAMAECRTAQGHVSYAWGALLVRRFTLFRAAACACTDVACAARVQTAIDKQIEVDRDTALDQADREAIVASSEAIAVCLYQARAELRQQALLDLRALRRDACACQDAACAEEVQQRFDAWLEQHKDTKGSKEDAETIGDLARELADCQRAATGEAP